MAVELGCKATKEKKYMYGKQALSGSTVDMKCYQNFVCLFELMPYMLVNNFFSHVLTLSRT